MDYKKEFIEFMIRSNVLTFGDFVTKSGRRTPYFVNTGNYKTGAQIAKLGRFYAECIMHQAGRNFDVLYGPAYKGIPLAVTTAVSLYHQYQWDVPYCFNRKEQKDHGEGGGIVGWQPNNGDRVLIIEDVITAGTSVRESWQLLHSVAAVNITSLVVSVDRRERGTGHQTALQELEEAFGIKTHAIVTIDEIIGYLHNREVDGKVIIDDAMKLRIEEYLREYGV
ncbi:orotate phosphoribosyltransferase [Hydrogenispora ethanolica]|jgi:orotate phosphoribosyltransferase|uniref:Orotate phosphoribosyltransferase n=1 Tax=Hydrogenispora ethanolica TaxID=1082276 RepID=A0A4R1RB34_HYDET|nr:orotate phosphoribosyltransferase [Hydrogenispora ethanolica]TCL62984.1 orotate phosphoribosyltransferase [Hydrogenispora ethanolica]